MITKHIDIVNNSITFIISDYDIIKYIKIFNDNKKDDIIDLFIENYFNENIKNNFCNLLDYTTINCINKYMNNDSFYYVDNLMY
jgi:hypothetical protein